MDLRLNEEDLRRFELFSRVIADYKRFSPEFRNANRENPSPFMISPESSRTAARYLAQIHGVTPTLPMERFKKDGIDITLWGKFENVQSMNTFKTRGAEWFIHNIANQYYNQRGMFRLKKPSSEAPQVDYLNSLEGVEFSRSSVVLDPLVFITASAGNHAQGVALAAKRHGFKAIIFMPSSVDPVKMEKVKRLGAEVILIDGPFDNSLKACLEFKQTSPFNIFVPPFEAQEVMVGQGTVGVEILGHFTGHHDNYMRVANDLNWSFSALETLPDVIFCGLGGGGLVSGIGAVVKEFNQAAGTKIKVIGVQSEAADSMYQSFHKKSLVPSSDLAAKTIAGGINVKNASNRMLSTVRKYADNVVLINEESILQSIVNIAEHPGLKNMRWSTNEIGGTAPFRKLPANAKHVYKARRMNRVEGAGAAGYAAAVFGDSKNQINWREIAGDKKRVNAVCVLSGGNIDSDLWRKIISERKRNLGCSFADDVTLRDDTPTVKFK